MKKYFNWLKSEASTILLVLTFSFAFVFLFTGTAPGETGRRLKDYSNHNQKLETRLEQIFVTANRTGPRAALQMARDSNIKVTPSRKIEVVVEEKPGEKISRYDVTKAGGEIVGETGNLKKISLPISEILSLAENLDEARYIRTPYTSVALGSKPARTSPSFVTSGTNLTGGSLYHANNYLGQDVKIAVIDLGFASLNYAREAGEIPDSVIADTEDYTGGGIYSGTAHGTGVTEIVHDMAPKAQLYLKRIIDEVDLGKATSDAISQGVDVIVHAAGWINTNFGGGTGIIAEIAKRASDSGVLWVNAAGNYAGSHWEGRARDDDGDGWLEFDAGQERITIENDLSQNIGLYMTWNDWPATDKDFDLFLYDAEGNLVKSSTNHQTGNEHPTEQITHSPASIEDYYLKVSGPEDLAGLELEIFSLNQALDPAVARGSIVAPGNVEEVFTVGAINESDWTRGPIEPYSSRGPTSDGRTKPDLASIDGVTLYTYRSFLGTSAAAPYVAGAGALVLSRSPDLGPDQLKEALMENAKDLGENGDDNTYGRGRMRLIFNSPSITRAVENSDGETATAYPGETITLRATAKMPLTLQGGLSVEESVPDPLEIKEAVSPESPVEVDTRKVEVAWSIVEPGTSKEVIYRVLIPEETEPGQYSIDGKINGKTTDSTEITVSTTSSPSLKEGSLNLEEARAVLDGFSSETEFRAIGENVYQIRVKVYDLQGREVFDSDWREGNTFQWNLLDNAGKSVSNGVYLYLVEVKGPNGEIERSEINRTLVIR